MSGVRKGLHRRTASQMSRETAVTSQFDSLGRSLESLKSSKLDIAAVVEALKHFERQFVSVKQSVTELALGINDAPTDRVDPARIDEVIRLVDLLIASSDVDALIDEWEFNGFEFFEQLRVLKRKSRLPSIASTAASALAADSALFDDIGADALAVVCHLLMKHSKLYSAVFRSADSGSTSLAVFMRKVIAFCLKIEDGYNEVPYHCVEHAVEVTFAVNWIMSHCRRLSAIGCVTHFAMLLCAAAHDVSHTGHSNAYHASVKSSIAFKVALDDLLVDESDAPRRHGSVDSTMQSSASMSMSGSPMSLGSMQEIVAVDSPLEQMHVDYALSLLDASDGRNGDCDWIQHVDLANALWIKRILTDCILATDMKHHMATTVELADMHLMASPKAGGTLQPKEITSMEQLLFNLKIVLKTADLSNAYKTDPKSRVWGELIAKESMRQVLHEKALLGEVRSKGALFDGKSSDAVIQCGFYGFISSFVNAFSQLFPECILLKQKFEANFGHWKDEKSKEKQMESAKKILDTASRVTVLDLVSSGVDDDSKSKSMSPPAPTPTDSFSAAQKRTMQKGKRESIVVSINDEILLTELGEESTLSTVDVKEKETAASSETESEDFFSTTEFEVGHESNDTTIITGDIIDLLEID